MEIKKEGKTGIEMNESEAMEGEKKTTTEKEKKD